MRHESVAPTSAHSVGAGIRPSEPIGESAQLLQGVSVTESDPFVTPSQISTSGHIRIIDGKDATGNVLVSASLGPDEDLRESGWSFPISSGQLYVQLTPMPGASASGLRAASSGGAASETSSSQVS